MSTQGRARILTTLSAPDRTEWASRCDTVDPKRAGTLERLSEVVRQAGSHAAVILDGSVGASEKYVDLIAAAAIRRTRRSIPVILTECQWKRSVHAPEARLEKLMARILDGPRIGYCVLTDWERERFPSSWQVDPERVFMTPYCHTLSAAELAAPVSTEGGVFAGGNSLRDYGPLVEAATAIDERFVLATSAVDGPTPANLTAGPVDERRYFELFRAARVVVVALGARPDRTAGQQTYLNAMALGKPLIVTDSPGVREYVEDGRTGIIVPPGDPQAMAEALRWMLDPANREEVSRMTAAAVRVAREDHSPERYLRSLLAVADRMSAQAA